MIKNTNYNDSKALVVEPENISDKNIFNIKKNFIIDNISSSGVLLFRGFSIDMGIFSDYIHKNSSKVSLDPARVFADKNVQKVDAGFDSVGLHLENAATPNVPDFIWFYCKKAAKKGSETTFCDGHDVLSQLSESTRQLFKNKKIRYSRRVPEQLWKKYVAYEAENVTNPNDVTLDTLEKFSSKIKDLSYSINSDNSINLSLCVSAIKTSKFSGLESFANSILGPSYNYEKPLITFEDGTKIADELLEEIKLQTERCTHEIQWEDNDIVVIDNTRVMHGRRAIEDPKRELFAGLSYA